MNWNDVIMKKRKFSRWILLLCCLFIPAFTAGAKAPLGTPTREVLLDMAWDCLEEYNFSCIRTNAVAVSKATQIMSEKEEQTETQQVETEQTQEAGMEEKQEVQVSEESGKEAVDATVVIDPANASTFHAGKFEGWGTSFCWWANRIGYSDTLTQQHRHSMIRSRDLG